MANVIVGTGSYLPERIVTNHEIDAAVTDYDRSSARGASLDQWARRKHGAVTRHRVAQGEATSDMATVAAKRALADAEPQLGCRDVELIVLATFTSDYRLPQAAGLVQANLRSRAKFIQVDSACSGFIDALFVTQGLMDVHGYETALVIGADVMTQVNDPERFMALTIFGDGAGAVVLRRDRDRVDRGICSFATGSDGELGSLVWMPAGGSKVPWSQGVLQDRTHYLRFKFSEIFTWGVDRMIRGTREAIERAGISLAEVRWVVPHQASVSIVAEVAQRLEVPMSRFVVTYPDTGNTSAASIPIALDRANRQGLFKDGDWLVLPAAGAGMAWGAATYRWYDYRAEAAR